MDVIKFLTLLKGINKGKNYQCNSPPHCFLPNHISCKPFTLFISNMLNDHLCSEAISFWGKVGECTSPSKRHLCNDDRLLHLWTEDSPFSFDSVQHLPKYVHKGI